MFGSTTSFGQSSMSGLFGSQPAFRQTNTTSPTPSRWEHFGTVVDPSPRSLFGGTSTGTFGDPVDSFGSTSTRNSLFCGTSTGSPTSPFQFPLPSCGTPSTPAFGFPQPAPIRTSPSGSIFQQAPPTYVNSPFGCAFSQPAFGFPQPAPLQTSPSGSTFQQAPPAYGNNPFGSASSQPAFRFPQPAPIQTSPFGSTFQQAQPAYGNNPFGCAFSQPTYGLQVPLLLVPQSPQVLVPQQPQNLQQQVPQRLVPQSPPHLGLQQIRYSIVLDFGCQVPQNSEPHPQPYSGGQNSSLFGISSTPFGTVTQSPVSTQSSPGGNLKAPPAPLVGRPSSFGVQQGGSRVTTYESSPAAELVNRIVARMQSISAMPIYNDKSHEELRWEDYRCGDKGASNASYNSRHYSRYLSCLGLDDGPSVRIMLGAGRGPFYRHILPNPTRISLLPGGPTKATFGRVNPVHPTNFFGPAHLSSDSSFFPPVSQPTVRCSCSSRSGEASMPAFSSSTVRSSSMFSSSRASGTVPPSGLSQAPIACTGQTPFPFGLPSFSCFAGSSTSAVSDSPSNLVSSPVASSSAFVSSAVHGNSCSGHDQSSKPLNGKIPPLFGTPAVISAPSVESSSGSGSSPASGSCSTRSSGISQSTFEFIPTVPSCSLDRFRTLSNSLPSVLPTSNPSVFDQATSAPSQLAGLAQTPNAVPISMFGWTPLALSQPTVPAQTTTAFPVSGFGSTLPAHQAALVGTSMEYQPDTFSIEELDGTSMELRAKTIDR